MGTKKLARVRLRYPPSRVLRESGATPAQTKVGIQLALGKPKPVFAEELGLQLASVMATSKHAYRDVCHNPCLRWLRQAGAVAVIILASVIPCIAQSHHGTPPVWWPCRIYVLKAICAPVPFSKSIYIFNPAVQENTAGSALNVHLLLSRKAHDSAKVLYC